MLTTYSSNLLCFCTRPKRCCWYLSKPHNLLPLYIVEGYFQTKSPFYFQEFVGNADQDTVVYHELSHAIRARYIRFRPTGWHGHISMRVEVYGCKGNAAFSSAKLAYQFLAVLFHARQKLARVPTKQKTPVTRRR